MTSSYRDFRESAERFSCLLEDRSEEICELLSTYQTYDVSKYEIDRSTKTLWNLEKNKKWLSHPSKIGSAVVLLPNNLPLYSLVIFACVPSKLCKSVIVRPGLLLQKDDLLLRLSLLLNLSDFFPNVEIVQATKKEFEPHFATADLVTFTGKPANAEKLLRVLKDGALLILNGSGHNPIVVAKDADLDFAVEQTVFVKSFNGGQDCAGPDAILVEEPIFEAFLERFTQAFCSVKVGDFDDTETVIGPIRRYEEHSKFSKVFHKNRRDIVSGGHIDFRRELVYPTVISRPVTDHPNYKEMFGPVAFVHKFKGDPELSHYFNDAHGHYQANKMYVSLYGTSPFLLQGYADESRKSPGILLHNNNIHGVEIGWKPYGGYALGASGVIKKVKGKVQRKAMPILIPEVIVKYLLDERSLIAEPLRTDRARPIDDLQHMILQVADPNGAGSVEFGYYSPEANTTVMCCRSKLEKSASQLVPLWNEIAAGTQFEGSRLLVLIAGGANDAFQEIEASGDSRNLNHALLGRKERFWGNGRLLSRLVNTLRHEIACD